MQAFNSELSTFESWLEKSSLYLEELSNRGITDNIAETERKFEEIHAFSQELGETKPRIEALRSSATGILEKSEINLSSLLSGKLEAAAYKWNVIVNKAKNLRDGYEGALKKNDDVRIINYIMIFYMNKNCIVYKSFLSRHCFFLSFIDHKRYRRLHQVAVEFREGDTRRIEDNIVGRALPSARPLSNAEGQS